MRVAFRVEQRGHCARKETTMNTGRNELRTSHALLRFGFALFLLGLLTGFLVPALANPRMALASHLEGILNGIFLMVLGLAWTRLQLTTGLRRLTVTLAVYGTFANWAATFLAAFWGAGRSMPLAANGHEGFAWQEMIVNLLLYSLSLAMVVLTGIVVWGLRGNPASGTEGATACRLSPLEEIEHG